MTVASLTQHSMLGPYVDVVLLLGPMLREDVRTDPGGRPMLVAETLASWSTTGSLSGFASAHRWLPLLVSQALKAQRTRSADGAVGRHHGVPRYAA